MKRDELERLYSISAQLKKGVEYISAGRVKIGNVWIQVATRDLNIMLTIVGAESGKE